MNAHREYALQLRKLTNLQLNALDKAMHRLEAAEIGADPFVVLAEIKSLPRTRLKQIAVLEYLDKAGLALQRALRKHDIATLDED